MTTETHGLLCEGACPDFQYWDEEWSIWICSLCDRPRAVDIGDRVTVGRRVRPKEENRQYGRVDV